MIDSDTEKCQILVIDENREDFVLISEYLKLTISHNFKVDFLPLQQLLLRTVKQKNSKPDPAPGLLLMQFHPLSRAREGVFKVVQEQYPGSPIVVMVEHFSEELSTQAGRLGAYGIIEKRHLSESQTINTILHSISLHNHLKMVYKKANFDNLTGLANRSLLNDRIQHAISRATRTNSCTVLMIIDIDDFKAINDSYGHDVGDLFLKEMASRQIDCVRKSDTVSRLGGDEFAVLLEGLSTPGLATLVAKKLLDSCREPMHLNGNKITPSLSIGISMIAHDKGQRFDSDWLFKSADTALYRAKKAGKNTYVVFSDEDNCQMIRTLKLEDQLVNAVMDNEFVLHYQPIFNTKLNKLSGFEALLRWQSSEGLVYPEQFMEVLIRLGLMEEIGEFVVSESLEQSVQWRSVGMDRSNIHINIAPAQFMSGSFCSNVKFHLETLAINPQDLYIELLERDLFACSKSFQHELHELSSLGVRIVIDNFGREHGSYNFLKDFDIDTIKLDRAYVKTMLESKTNMAITQSIIGLARDLDLNLVAEGVENKEQIDSLKKLGVKQMQGFYLGTPMRAYEFEQKFLCNKQVSDVVAFKI